MRPLAAMLRTGSAKLSGFGRLAGDAVPQPSKGCEIDPQGSGRDIARDLAGISLAINLGSMNITPLFRGTMAKMAIGSASSREVSQPFGFSLTSCRINPKQTRQDFTCLTQMSLGK
jgi:hypothetical protein